jgi:hypothetical protein
MLLLVVMMVQGQQKPIGGGEGATTGKVEKTRQQLER